MKLKKLVITMEKKEPINPAKAETSRLWHAKERELLGEAVHKNFERDRKREER